MPFARRKTDDRDVEIALVPVERVLFAIGRTIRPEAEEDADASDDVDAAENDDDEGEPYPSNMYAYETPEDNAPDDGGGEDDNDDAPPKEEERRGAPRKPIFSDARLFFPCGRLYECMIVDYSASGVRLRFRSAIDLPDTLRIRSQRPALNTEARVVWSDGNTAALEFVDTPGSDEQLAFDF